MAQSIAAFVRETKEYRGWGMNVLTLGFLLVLATTSFEVWGLSNQIVTLWSPETVSARGVSISMKLIVAIYYFAAFNRGRTGGNLGLTIAGGVVALMHLPLIVGLWRVAGFQWWEWTFALVSVSSIILAFQPRWQDSVFKVISTVIAGVLLLQPLEMYLKHTASGLNLWDPAGFLASCLVWTLYGAYIKDKTVAGFSILYGCIYATTLVLWWMYTH